MLSLPCSARERTPEGGGWPGDRLSEPLPAMLLLWMSLVAVSALAVQAPGAGEQRRGAAKAPNVVLVVSDSFVSTARQGRGAPLGTGDLPAAACAASFG